MTAKTTRGLAFLLLFGVICGIGLLTWAGSLKTGIVGPSVLAEDSLGRVWMIANGSLYLLKADGALIRSWPGKQLGIGGQPSALSGFDQGRVLVGSREAGRIFVIDDSGHSELLVDPAQTASGALFDAFALAYDPRARNIYVSDTNGHRMLAFSQTGALLATAGGGADHRFHFPNAIGVDANGQLYVANTNRHRVDFVAADLSIGSPLASFDSQTMDCCPWPAAASVAPGGQRYASWLRGSMNQGSVFKFDADGKALFEIELPNPGAWIVSLLARDMDVLAADSAIDGFTVHRFGHDGRYLGAFGDARVLQRLDDGHRKLRDYQRLRSFGTLLAVLCCAGLLVAARKLQGVEVEQAVERNPLPIRRYSAATPAFARLIGLTLVLAVVLALANQGLQRGLHALLPDATPLQSLGMGLLSVVLWLLVLVLAQRAMIRSSYLHTINRTRAEHFLRVWAPHLQDLLDPGEAIIGATLVIAMNSPGRRYRLINGLLVWTGRRLLILAVLPGLRRAPLWALWLADIDAPSVTRLKRGWLYWLQGGVEQIELTLPGGTTGLVLANPADSAEIAADISGRAAANVGDPDAPAGAGGRAAGAPPATMTDPRVRRSAMLLSLLLPGLGHFHQRRILVGAYLLLFGLLFAGQAFVALHAYWFQTMAVGIGSLKLSLGVTLAFWIASLADVYRYNRPPPAAKSGS